MKPAHRPRTAARAAPRKLTLLVLAGALALGTLYLGRSTAAEKAVSIPAPSATVLSGLAPANANTETAVLAGGCFWGIQAVFQHTKGVLNAVSGYAGGRSANPHYEDVSSGDTGHAEAVQVTYDPKQISYGQLLQIYFSVAHDPTQLNQQYPDSGTQYRSNVFYQSEAQKLLTERYIAQLNAAKVFPGKIVTQVSALQGFYPAERYHQNYATLHPDSMYIARYDLPKLDHLKSLLPALYREQPVLVQQ